MTSEQTAEQTAEAPASEQEYVIRGRLLAAREAREEAELFAALVEALPDAIVLVDQLGTIRFLNRACELLFGYPRLELMGQPHAKLIPEAKRTIHENHRSRYQEEPRTPPMGGAADLILVGRRKNGSEIPVEIMLVPIVTSAGLYTAALVRRHKAGKISQ